MYKFYGELKRNDFIAPCVPDGVGVAVFEEKEIIVGTFD